MTVIKSKLLIIIFTLLALINLSFSDKNDFFSIIILPDTQYYTSRFPDFIYKQMEWIVKNKGQYNIQYVVHMGDITDDNKESAWEVASSSYKILENAGIPYSIVCGDNDIKDPEKNNYDGTRHTELLNRYFPVSRFEKQGSWWKGGFFEKGKIDNYYCNFNYREYKFMIMNLEIAPRSIVLKWADNIIAGNKSEKVIVVTHDYLDSDGKRLDDLKSFRLDGQDAAGKAKGNNADDVFKKLVKKNSNIIMVLCGHKEGTFEKTVKVKLPEDPDKTRRIFEILTDFQDEKIKGSDEKSGKGLLRVLKIYPQKNEYVLSTVNALTGKTREEEIHLYLEKN
ncbi:MAG: metallophosphoesterase [Bacteroidales bacterium]|nr:metallophosphoesterase [Bacteroidales bacterium]